MAGGGAAALAVERVEVTGGGRRLLGPVSIAFAPGAVHGIIGHNGSGKSTLLKLLARQAEPSAGVVTLGTEPLPRLGARAFARRVAYLPQALPSTTGLTVRELVEQGRYPWHGALGRVTAADRDAVAGALAAADLDGYAERAADALSGGERQRAWIAMLIAQGAAVVAVLHDINMAARFCDRLVALKAGRVLADGAPGDVMRPDVLHAIYGLPMAVLPRGEGAPVAVPA